MTNTLMTDNYAPDVEQRLRSDAAKVTARYPQSRSAIMPLLHLIQSEDGYVSPRGIVLIADLLGLSRAMSQPLRPSTPNVVNIAVTPNGEYNVGVRTNSLCAAWWRSLFGKS